MRYVLQFASREPRRGVGTGCVLLATVLFNCLPSMDPTFISSSVCVCLQSTPSSIYACSVLLQCIAAQTHPHCLLCHRSTSNRSQPELGPLVFFLHFLSCYAHAVVAVLNVLGTALYLVYSVPT